MTVPRQKNAYASRTARRPAAEHLAGCPGEARHHGDRGWMSCRELLADVPAREGLESAVTALVGAVPAAGTAVRPLEKS